MPISFTKHALERMRIRPITKEAIIDTINNPEKELNDSFGNVIALKVKKKFFELNLRLKKIEIILIKKKYIKR